MDHHRTLYTLVGGGWVLGDECGLIEEGGWANNLDLTWA